MSRDTHNIRDIKKRAAADWLELPGVNAVGIGSKERGDQFTGEMAIKVFVTAKKPQHAIPAGEVIPNEVNGIPTDVVVLGPIRRNRVRPSGVVVLDEQYEVDDRKRYRPLKGGSQTQAKLNGALKGTLGCFLRDPSDASRVYALTAHHVYADKTRGLSTTTDIGQPTKKDSMTKCCSHIFGKYAAPDPANRPMEDDLETVAPNPRFGYDAAVARLEPGTKWTADILEIGPPRGIHTLTEDDANNRVFVCKRGFASGLTGGRVNAADVVCKDEPHEAILIDGIDPPGVDFTAEPFPVVAFSLEGDSGSAILDHQGRVVALLTQECETRFLGSLAQTKTLAYPISLILDEFRTVEGLNLEVATETSPGVEHTVPSASASDSTRRTISIPSRPVRDEAERDTPEVTPGFSRLEADLDRSRRGRTIISTWIEHQEELNALVNGNRPVTVAWHRNGGPELMQVLLRAIEVPGYRMPDRLAGKPLPAALEAIRLAFVEHGSPELAQGFEALQSALPPIRAMTYPEFLKGIEGDEPHGDLLLHPGRDPASPTQPST